MKLEVPSDIAGKIIFTVTTRQPANSPSTSKNNQGPQNLVFILSLGTYTTCSLKTSCYPQHLNKDSGHWISFQDTHKFYRQQKK